jgi:hypothetical protein
MRPVIIEKRISMRRERRSGACRSVSNPTILIPAVRRMIGIVEYTNVEKARK